MAVVPGIVQSVSRDQHYVRVQGQGAPLGSDFSAPAQRPTYTGKYWGDWPPPPLSYVELDQIDAGIYRVHGAVADRKVTFHEDWLSVNWAPPILYGDLVWSSATTSIAEQILQSAPSGTQPDGCLDLVTDAAANHFCEVLKDNDSIIIDANRAQWFSARIAPWKVTNQSALVGLSGSVSIYLAVDNAASSLVTIGGATSVLSLPFTFQANVFSVVDIVFVPDVFAACWIDGTGPFVSTSNVPSAGSSLGPFVYVSSGAVPVLQAVFCDWVHMESFAPVANPLRDLVIPQSGLVG